MYCKKMSLYKVCFVWLWWEQKKTLEHDDWMQEKWIRLTERGGRVYGNYCNNYGEKESPWPSL